MREERRVGETRHGGGDLLGAASTACALHDRLVACIVLMDLKEIECLTGCESCLVAQQTLAYIDQLVELHVFDRLLYLGTVLCPVGLIQVVHLRTRNRHDVNDSPALPRDAIGDIPSCVAVVMALQHEVYSVLLEDRLPRVAQGRVIARWIVGEHRVVKGDYRPLVGVVGEDLPVNRLGLIEPAGGVVRDGAVDELLGLGGSHHER